MGSRVESNQVHWHCTLLPLLIILLFVGLFICLFTYLFVYFTGSYILTKNILARRAMYRDKVQLDDMGLTLIPWSHLEIAVGTMTGKRG